jgi:hypothetical protein
MPVTASEAYLHALAERTFLKVWAIPNPFRAPGKEISDLVVVFGNDTIIFSDKSCRYDPVADPDVAWRRWRRQAIDASISQLGGALRQLSSGDTGIYLDAKAAADSPVKMADPADRRFHMVAIARPDTDPTKRPPGCKDLVCVGRASGRPFEVEPQSVGGSVVHVFDGAAIDLLLGQLDTAPDFIAYLAAREQAIRVAGDYAFREADLLAEAVMNWSAGSGLTAAVPALSNVRQGAWAAYARSERAAQTQRLNLPSRSIDNLIEHFHSAYRTGSLLSGPLPAFERHEVALRLLAAESRFARRMIVAPLYDIREEKDQAVPWLATVPSPSRSGLRYVWLSYPDPPATIASREFERVVDRHLAMAILQTRSHFPADLIVGISVPNAAATENVYGIKVFDGSHWTDDESKTVLGERLFGPPIRTDYEHVP